MTPTAVPQSNIGKFTQTSGIALTTRFTAPTDCTDADAYSYWWNTASSCFPSPKFGSYQESASNSLWYSPGVCPYKYNYVATSVQSSGPGGLPITLAICCPPYEAIRCHLQYRNCTNAKYTAALKLGMVPAPGIANTLLHTAMAPDSGLITLAPPSLCQKTSSFSPPS